MGSDLKEHCYEVEIFVYFNLFLGLLVQLSQNIIEYVVFFLQHLYIYAHTLSSNLSLTILL